MKQSYALLTELEEGSNEWNQAVARNAVLRFQTISPVLRKLAVAITGDRKVTVDVGAMSATDGKIINVCPPAEFGIFTTHDRAVCDKIGPDGKPLCKACDTHEETMAILYHEIAHIAFNTMAKFDEYRSVSPLLEQIHLHLGNPDPDLPDRIIRKIREEEITLNNRGQRLTVWGASRFINPYMVSLLNALEDARVNAAIGKRMVGVQRMLKNRYDGIMAKGITYNVLDLAMNEDPTAYRDLPLNAQATLACLWLASGFGVDETLGIMHEDMAELINDKRLQDPCAVVAESGGVEDALGIAIPVLRVCQDHGFLLDESEEEPEPEPEEEEDDPQPEGGDEEGDDPGGDEDEDGQPGDDGQPGEGDGEGDEGDEEDSPGGDGEPGEDGAPGEGDEPGEGGDGDPDEPGEGEGEGEGDEPGEGEGEGEGDTEGEGEGECEGDDDASGQGGQGTIMGSSDDVEKILAQVSDHDDLEESEGEVDVKGDQHLAEVEVAGKQIREFEHFSASVVGVEYLKWTDTDEMANRCGFSHTFDFPEVEVDNTIVNAAVAKARFVFSENQASRYSRNLKSGPRIDRKSLALRAPVNDPRMFGRKTVQEKRDYHVILGIDQSGSAMGYNIKLQKEIALHMGEMLGRLGVTFEIFGHSGESPDLRGKMYADYSQVALTITEVKLAKEIWGPAVKERLAAMTAGGVNLDGHTMEVYLNRLERSKATDKLLIYSNDGKCPYWNYDEELELIRESTRRARNLGITTLGLGVGCDDLKQHGFDTVQVDSTQDVPAFVKALERKVLGR